MKKSFIIIFWIFSNLTLIFSQEDSTKTVLEAYKLTNNYSDLIQSDIDTGLHNLHITDPLFKNGISYSFTGNLASPYIEDIFYERDFVSDYYLMKPYRLYNANPEDIIYYKTNKPFTNIGYHTNTGGKEISEHNVSVLHTQNFGTLNVGFNILHIGGKGLYERQKTTNGNGFVFAHYNGIKYELFVNANISNFLLEQNGGLDDSLFINDDVTASPNLLFAETEIKNKSFQVTQKYRLGIKIDTVQNTKGSIGAFAHTISLEQNKRTFIDNLENTRDTAYYADIFYDNTFDTSYYQNLTNQIRFEVYESDSSLFSVFGHVGLNMENVHQFNTTAITDSSFAPKNKLQTTNLSLIWNLGQDKKYYYWNVNGGYYFAGYKQFDINFNSKITFRVLDYELSGYYNFNNIEPDFFYKKYESNHFSWNNSFNKIQINDIGAVFVSKRHKFKAQVNNRLTTNLIYFNEDALPNQADKVANVLSIEAEKTIELWKLKMLGKGIYQQTNAYNYLAVPEWIFHSSIYLDYVINFKLTGGKLAFQLGTDFYYKSRFYGYKYNPVFEQFYLQKETKIGGYPYVTPFLNVQIKKVRFYLKYEHINQLINDKKNYYSLVNNPRNPNNLKFGLFWHFYD
jgi:hypothetical protein